MKRRSMRALHTAIWAFGSFVLRAQVPLEAGHAVANLENIVRLASTPGGDEVAVYSDNVPVDALLRATWTDQYGFVYDISGFTSFCTSTSDITITLGIHAGEARAVTLRANSDAQPGQRNLNCVWPGFVTDRQNAFRVYDATPRIDSMTPNAFDQSNVEVPVAFTGIGFGIRPPALEISPAGVAWRIGAGNTPTQFVAYLTAPNPGNYDVAVESSGNGATGFQPGTPPQSSSRSGKRRSGLCVSHPALLSRVAR